MFHSRNFILIILAKNRTIGNVFKKIEKYHTLNISCIPLNLLKTIYGKLQKKIHRIFKKKNVQKYSQLKV